MKLPYNAKTYRHWFEDDTDFPGRLKPLLDGYNEAATKAYSTAKDAIQDGDRKTIREAQWWEGVATTIEQCLSSFMDNEGKEGFFELPSPPNFDV